MKQPTQCELIIRHIDEHGSITRKQAMRYYGIGNLPARINELRNAGYDIETVTEKGKNRYGVKTEYGRYRWRKPVM